MARAYGVGMSPAGARPTRRGIDEKVVQITTGVWVAGYTLLEVLTALGVLAIVSAIAFPELSS